METTKKFFYLTLFLLQCHVHVLNSYNVPCTFNTMCLCWIQDDDEFARMDISCLGVPFARFPDQSIYKIKYKKYVEHLNEFNDEIPTEVSVNSRKELAVLNNIQSKSNSKFKTTNSSKIELIECSGVYLEKYKLDYIHDTCRQRPTVYCRTLLKSIIGEREIARCTRTGRNAELSLPENIVSCVLDVSVNYVAQLDIVNSGMQSLENDALVSSSRVEALGLMSNRLSTIGEKSLIGVSNTLRSLDLSYNLLEKIPFKAIQGLRKLNWLNMHSNHLTTLDGDWGHVSSTLTNGFFGENNIVEIPKIIGSFDNLILLNLDGNNIEEIEDESLPLNIRSLSLNNNLFKSFPQCIENFSSLKWIYLRGNFIKILKIPELKSKTIELLDVSENLIESIVIKSSLTSTTNSNSIFKNDSKILNIKDLNISNNKLTILKSNMFDNIEVRRIHLSSNNIKYIDDDTFKGLENILEYLNLENNGLYTVPSALTNLKSISYLYLGNNDIQNISNDAFDSFAMNLRVLSLSNNNLLTLPVDALSSCSKLLHLNLGYNKITDINIGDLIWAKNLEILILRNNLLTKLKPGVFKGAYKLKELSLSFNQLNDLDNNTFIGIENTLEILELSFAFSNDILPKYSLLTLTNLIWLILDNNNFHNIYYDSFYKFKKLQYINLESNRFQYLPDQLFTSINNNHQQLKEVKLGYNFIKYIPEYTFINLTQLRSIDLTGNRIQHLTNGIIQMCPKLITISLAYNQISKIDKGAFHGLISLRFLHLEFNALTNLDLDSIILSGGPDFALNVSFNSISFINYTSGLNTNLTTLDLSYNNLTLLSGSIFTNMIHLKQLNLQNNFITTLQPGTFSLVKLETLNLRNNRLETLRKQAFHGSILLQQLDLSGNSLSQLSTEQFRNLKNLRILNLSKNHLRSLPRGVFEGTIIEVLDLSVNKITILPSPSFNEVGYTLRDLNLGDNFIEHLDATTFPTSHLTSLNLSNNRLTILPDNSFESLTKLISLNLSRNYLQTNFKELFHYLPNLKELYMIDCGFKKIPILPLKNLNILDLSFNSIVTMSQTNVQFLESLKILWLVNNSLTIVPDVRLQLLRQLDLSGNSIEYLNKDSFVGYPMLQILLLNDLKRIKFVDNDCLHVLRYLKHLRIQTWPQAGNLDLSQLLSGLPLHTVEIEVTEPVLNNQIQNAFNKKLKELTITGQQLELITSDAFKTIHTNQLILRIKNTHVTHFQSDIFFSLARKISQFTLDLRNNHINELSPSVIYGNLSWETVGTNFVSGGLQVSGNPLECDCEIAWLSLWLRRWLRESRQIHTASQLDAQQLRNLAGQAVCTMPSHSSDQVLLTLGTPHTACQASALSSGHYLLCDKSFFIIIIFIIKFNINYI